MNKKDKLIASIVARPSEASFADVKAVLELYGWVEVRSKGSHHSFVSSESTQTFVVPSVSGRRVKGRYLDELCRLLDLDEKV